MQVKERHPWEILRDFLEQDDSTGLNDYLSSLTGEQSLRAVTRLDPEEQRQIMARLSPESAAEFIEFIPNEPAAELLSDMNPRVAASIVHELDSDDAADVLAELDEEDLEEILRYMDEREAGDARQLLAYDEDVAGGLMMTEYFSFPRAFRAGAVLQDLARRDRGNEALCEVTDLVVVVALAADQFPQPVEPGNQGIGVMPANHENDRMEQDEPVQQRCQRKTVACPDDDNQGDDCRCHLEPPGRVVVGIDRRPCQNAEEDSEPDNFHRMRAPLFNKKTPSG